MKVLKPGGRAGIVLPDGTLFGEGVKTRIKETLLNDCNLHTIVRLPNGVFNPYTGIRTNLLFFTKGQPTTEVWYYEHPYPEGARATTRVSRSASKSLSLRKGRGSSVLRMIRRGAFPLNGLRREGTILTSKTHNSG